MKLTVKNTVKFSLIVQLITGIITLYGLFITLDEKHNILRGILGLETLVQFVELSFYLWIAYKCKITNDDTSKIYRLDDNYTNNVINNNNVYEI